MTVTRLFIGCALGVCLLTLALWPLGLHVAAFVWSNLALACLLAADWLFSPKPAALVVRRADGDKLYFKTDNAMVFHVENNSPYALTMEAKDEIPDRHFTVTAADLTHTVPPGGEVAFSYTVTPGKRGEFPFAAVHLRYRGVLGLCVKYARLPCPVLYRVYPNVKDLSKYRLLTRQHRLLPPGERAVRARGAGAEFESLRAYVEGDDYRKINWAATARENRLIVNQYQTEKNQPVMLLLDTGRPMSYAVGGYKKLDYAINAALILSDIVNEKGDQSGLLVFDAGVQAHIKPGKGAAHKHTLMETLYQVRDSRQTSDYEGAFNALCEKQTRRALVFIFTDFEILEEAEELIAHIALLKRRHFPIVVFMRNDGLNALAEQPAHDKKDAVLRGVARAFQSERKQIFKALHRLGVPNIESGAEDFALAAVNRYLGLRR